MPGFKLCERVRLCIHLALTADRGEPRLFARQETEARRLGMVGAEIDAARRGCSFDVQTSRALALATASDEHARGQQRERAVRAGVDEHTCSQIERLAESIVRSSPAAVGGGVIDGC